MKQFAGFYFDFRGARNIPKLVLKDLCEKYFVRNVLYSIMIIKMTQTIHIEWQCAFQSMAHLRKELVFSLFVCFFKKSPISLSVHKCIISELVKWMNNSLSFTFSHRWVKRFLNTGERARWSLTEPDYWEPPSNTPRYN